MKRNVIRVKGADGEVCIQPNGSHDPASTFCLHIESNGPWLPTNEEVTCNGCIQNYNALKDGIKLVGV